MTDHAVAPDHGSESIAHVMSMPMLLAVFLGLLVLTAVTLLAAQFNLGAFGLAVALGIATLKAALVVLFFMHLRYDNPFHALIFVTGLLFLAIFLGAAMLDTLEYAADIQQYQQTHSP